MGPLLLDTRFQSPGGGFLAKVMVDGADGVYRQLSAAGEIASFSIFGRCSFLCCLPGCSAWLSLIKTILPALVTLAPPSILSSWDDAKKLASQVNIADLARPGRMLSESTLDW